IEEVADLDVTGAERSRALQQRPAQSVGSGPSVAGRQEPVGEELELEVADAVVFEYPPHLGQAMALPQMQQVGVPDAEARKSGLRSSLGTLAQTERAPLLIRVGLGAAADRPVRGEQLGAAHCARAFATFPQRRL